MATTKLRYAIYYQGDSAPAKKLAQELRDKSNSTTIVDADAFVDKEQADVLEFVNVDDDLKKRIQDSYNDTNLAHLEPGRELDNGDSAPQKITIPDNWKKLSWTQLQALAAEIAPDETVRNKTDAKRIIADYIDDNSQEHNEAPESDESDDEDEE